MTAKLSPKQILILFLISKENGIKDVYSLVKIFDRADFPSDISENIEPLKMLDFITISKYFENGTPSEYNITTNGLSFLHSNFNREEINTYIQACHNPESLLQITNALTKQ